jgi:hypothetical protein
MEREFISYEQALALKKLGFDEMCFGFYRSPSVELMHCRNREGWMGNQVVAAPLKQQVLRWFRDKYNLIGLVEGGYTEGKNVFSYVIWRGSFDDWIDTYWSTYEEAENACIDKLIEIAKQQE